MATTQTDTAAVEAAIQELRALSVAPLLPSGRCQVAVTPATLDALCDVAEAAARYIETRGEECVCGSPLGDNHFCTICRLDAALARLADA